METAAEIAGTRKVKDEVLVGDGEIGTERVGWFGCADGDGSDAEDELLARYRAGYSGVRPVYRLGCLDAVELDDPGDG